MRDNIVTVEMRKALNTIVFNAELKRLKFKPGQRTVLSKKGHEITLKGVLTSTLSNIYEFNKKIRQLLARFVMENSKKMESKNKFVSFPFNLKLLLVKSGNTCGGCKIILDNYDHELNSTNKSISVGSTNHRVFVDESNRKIKARNRKMVFGEDNKYGFSKNFLLLHL